MIVPQLVLAVAWTFGANGFLIESQLAGANALPAAHLLPVAGHARIVFHDRPDWAMAFYLPAADPDSAPDPRLFLYAPYYLAPGGLVAASGMPVDVAEYYLHAVVEASLDLERAAGSSYWRWTRARAGELMAEVTEPQQLAAYIAALADFGAHLLSIRNEIWRAAERQAASGRDLCRHLDRPASLFGLWRRSLGESSYFGTYRMPGEDGTSRQSRSRQPLAPADKARFLTEVLGIAWTGDPAADFAELCAGSAF